VLAGVEQLSALYVEARGSSAAGERKGARDGAAILWRRCAGAFEGRRRGLGVDAEKRIAASQYTREGAIRCGIDCGYRPEWDYPDVSCGLSLEGDLEAAKVGWHSAMKN